MTIAVEEVHRAPKALKYDSFACPLIPLTLTSNQIQNALTSATPAFLETFSRTVTSTQNMESEKLAAFKCLQAWVAWGLTGK